MFPHKTSYMGLWLLLFMAVFTFSYNAVINHFYFFGPTTDPAWFAGMIWKTDASLPLPSFLDSRNVPYISNHLSPIFILPMAISHLLSDEFGLIRFYSVVIGLFHAITITSISYYFAQIFRNKAVHIAFAMLMTAGLMLPPLVAQHLALPHFEILMAGFIFLFLVHLIKGNTKLTLLFFILAFTVREDAGFHIFGFLSLMLAYKHFIQNTAISKRELAYCFGSFLGSCALLFIIDFVNTYETLGHRTYVGDPAFAHITLEHVKNRIDLFITRNQMVWLPMITLIIISIIQRTWFYCIGALAVTPWIVLHVIFAIHYSTGILAYYYNFPVIVALAWPIIGHLFFQKTNDRIPPWKTAVFTLSLVIASYGPFKILAPNYAGFYVNMSYKKLVSKHESALYNDFTIAFSKIEGFNQNMVGNIQALALSPTTFMRTNWIDPAGRTSLSEEEKQAVAEKIDSFLIFDTQHYCDLRNGIIAHMKDVRRYHVTDTELYYFTSRPESDLEAIKAFITEQPMAPPPCRIKLYPLI